MNRSGRILVDPPQSGAVNMAVDEALLSTANSRGQSTLRIYQWSEPTLSLGYFQSWRDRGQHPASSTCAMVRRSSGGGAILHDQEWTYSLTLPVSQRWSQEADRLVETVHGTLIDWLGSRGIAATVCQGLPTSACPPDPAPFAHGDPRPPREGKHVPSSDRNGSFLCFMRRACGDLLVHDDKIVGSAQRRSRGAVLQHGSVLLRRSSYAPELPGLCDFGLSGVEMAQFVTEWVPRLSEALAILWINEPLDRVELAERNRWIREKYSNPDWTQKR